MKYRRGYKIQVAEDFSVVTDIHPEKYVRTKFILLSKRGKLTVKNGYACDGPSGTPFDTPNFMTPAVVHDALYQLMRHELLDISWRVPADKLLRAMCIDRGMWRIRAWWVFRALQLVDGNAALPENKKEIIEVP